MIKLDIGSGRAHFEDYITVDAEPAVGADIVYKLGENQTGNLLLAVHQLAGGNGLADVVRAHHILEHTDPLKKVETMIELVSMLKPGGLLDIEVPIFPHPASIQDPTHISFWNKQSFWYFTIGNKFGDAFVKRYPTAPRLEFIREYTRGDEKNPWAYGIILKKPL